MNDSSAISQLVSRLDKIEKNQKALYAILTKGKESKTWVKASTILGLTGWNREKLRQMRIHGIVKFKKDNGFFYHLESVPDIFLKAKAI